MRLLNSERIHSGSTHQAKLLLAARGVRAVADGVVSLVLPAYLIELGYGAWETGAIATATLVGSALLTLAIGLYVGSWSHRALLRTAAILMMLTGLGFVAFEDFWPLLLVAFVGTLNPSSGDVSVFLPLEQAELARLAPDQKRTRSVARSRAGSPPGYQETVNARLTLVNSDLDLGPATGEADIDVCPGHSPRVSIQG